MNDFSIILTATAEQFLLNKVNNNNKAIQLRLKRSGCSGFSYVLNIVDESPNNIKFRNIPFDILEEDKKTLNNILVDLKKEGFNTKLVFENPQAFDHCGCGESFSIRR